MGCLVTFGSPSLFQYTTITATVAIHWHPPNIEFEDDPVRVPAPKPKDATQDTFDKIPLTHTHRFYHGHYLAKEIARVCSLQTIWIHLEGLTIPQRMLIVGSNWKFATRSNCKAWNFMSWTNDVGNMVFRVFFNGWWFGVFSRVLNFCKNKKTHLSLLTSWKGCSKYPVSLRCFFFGTKEKPHNPKATWAMKKTLVV